MKTKVLGTVLWLLVFIVGMTGAVWCASYPTATAPSIGDGSSGNPYQIANLENLYWIVAPEVIIASPTLSTRWGAYYIQTAGIDASNTDGGTGWGTEGWTPIGNSTTKFTGSYDGDGYVIDELFIDRSSTDYQGLFGYTDGATLSDLGVVNVDVSGNSNVAGLVGYSNSSLISKCYTSGNIVGNPSSSYYTGGLVGYSNLGSTSNSYTTCNVSGYVRYGGLIGQIAGSTITSCYSTGRVSGVNGMGLIGYRNNTTTLTNCFWDMETSLSLPLDPPSTSFGGGTGKNTAEMMQQSTFTDWDFTSTWDIVGGGASYPYLRNTYAPPVAMLADVEAGDVDLSWSAPTATPSGYNIYRNGEKMNSSLETNLTYNDGTVSIGTRYSYCVTAVYGDDTSQPSNQTPYLDLRFSRGTGKDNDPYEISTHAQLSYLADHLNNPYVNFILLNALDLTAECLEGGAYYNAGAGWTPIGTSGTGNQFKGSFDGAGYVITGLKINRPSSDNIGLFGYTNGATLTNVKLESVTITGNDELGGLVGWNNTSTISNSYVTGTITGANAGWAVGGLVGYNVASNISGSHASGTVTGTGVWEIGGLIGYNESSSVITNCYAAVTVNGGGEVGGLSGISDDCTYTGCYATGNVSGTDGYVGGLIGDNYGGSIFSNCYATGDAVSTGGGYIGGFAGELISDEVSNCYATGNATDNSADDQSYTGGFAGYSSSSTISHTTAGGNVSGHYYVGGLIGKNSQTSIDYSSATGAVTSTADLVGGLVGENDKSSIEYCYATGNVTGTGTSYIGSSGGPESYEIGGLIGVNKSGTVTNCYASGHVSGYSNIGGLVGMSQTAYISPTLIIAEISNCYSVGSVTGTTNTGGLVGNNTGTIAHCRWDTETSGKTTGIATSTGTYESCSDTLGKTTVEMKTEDITSWSWSTSIWQRVGYNYPSLIENFDQSLPVELASFTVKITDEGDVLLQWITESEVENQGFNLYRGTSKHGDYQKINSALIPGAGSSPERHTYRYFDQNSDTGHPLWYQLEDVDFTGTCTRHEPISLATVAKVMPKEFCLYPNYPNPFNPVTQFTYEIPETRAVHIAIYGITGAKVCDLFNATQEPGAYILRWDGTDTQGTVLPSGIYFVVIRAGRDYDTFKMTLLR